MATKTLSASLDPAIYRATQRVATEERRPQSAVVADALRLYTGLPLETRQAVLALERQLGEEATASKLGAAVRTAALVVSLAEPDGLVPIAGRLDALTRHPADNAVLETALVGRAAFLVTGNPKHFVELPGERHEHDRLGVYILGPREFLQALA